MLGLLGPNGAGKTTTVRMMTTLTRPTSGTGRVAGHDILTDPAAVRRSMGLTGQAATVDELLTGRENLRLIGQLYGLDPAYIAARERRAARALLARRRGRPHRQDLLRRHAATARPRGQPDRDAARAVPRRADHGPRPALARGAVGGAARARRRRHDPAADDAIPRGGRPARRQHRRDRPRHGHRRGHAAAAQGPVRCGRARRHRLPGAGPRRPPRRCCAPHVREVHVDRGRPPAHRARRGPGPHDTRRRHLRRERHRARRHRAQAPEPRRRLPPPHRAPRRGGDRRRARPTTETSRPEQGRWPDDARSSDPRSGRPAC